MSYEGVQLGHYQLLKLIGSGGMSDVYLANDPHLHRQVAIKVIRAGADWYPNTMTSQEAIRLFKREMQVIASLDHPNILPVYEANEQSINGTPLMYMVMPFRQVGSLADWLHQHGDILSPQVVGGIILQAAEALQQAHDKNIIHQDIKPSNFLIRGGKEFADRLDLQLADFGIAKVIAPDAKMTMATRGTPIYMAPEQWQGHPVAATDQYALAIMAYHLLTGKPPFQGNQPQVMYQHLQEQPPPPSHINPQISPALDPVILRALAKKPDDRFPTIMAFAYAFQQALVGTSPRQSQKVVLPPQATEEKGNEPLGTPRQTDVATDLGTSSSPTSNSRQGTALLYGIATVLLSLFVGAALYALGRLPSYIVTMVSIIWGVLGAIVGTIIVNLFSKATIGPTLRQAKRSLAISASIVTVALLAVIILFLPPSLPSTIASTDHAPTATSNTVTTTISSADATATVIAANPDNYPPADGTLALYDPLSQPGEWNDMSFPSTAGKCQFTNDSYHVIESNSQYFAYCPGKTHFINFAFEVQMTILLGDCGGIVFRASGIVGNNYLVVVCQDQTYSLYVIRNNGIESTLISNNKSLAIHQGLKQSNVVAVVANGVTLTLYVNYQNVGSVTDNAYSEGQVGVVAYPVTQSTEVIYKDARVWNL